MNCVICLLLIGTTSAYASFLFIYCPVVPQEIQRFLWTRRVVDKRDLLEAQRESRFHALGELPFVVMSDHTTPRKTNEKDRVSLLDI